MASKCQVILDGSPRVGRGLIQVLGLTGETMGTANRSTASALSIFGYVVWFAILVRLLYMATNDQSSGAESLGLHLGLGLSLLAILGVPYFIVRLRAKRRGESVSWFLVMMWTTIIALLLAMGGFYGRLYLATHGQTSQPQAAPLQGAASAQVPTTAPVLPQPPF